MSGSTRPSYKLGTPYNLDELTRILTIRAYDIHDKSYLSELGTPCCSKLSTLSEFNQGVWTACCT